MMAPARLEELLARLPGLRVVLVGDFFLDKYLTIDPALTETSLETGLPAWQVTSIRAQPGAAGTVAANLRALSVGRVAAVSVVGEDGEGDDLRRGLLKLGVGTDSLLVAPELLTPTYTKPMHRQPDGSLIEQSRLDHKNRAPLPEAVEVRLIAALREAVADADAVMVLDQVEERNCGVVTDRLRAELAQLARERPSVVFFADSRERIGQFANCVLKPNQREAVRALDLDASEPFSRESAERSARRLAERGGRPVFLTLGEEGMVVYDRGERTAVPGLPAPGPTDSVGAGDSAAAGLVAALCAGATPAEAALIGCLAAATTVRQLGTTGIATPADLRQRLRELGR